MKGLYSSYTKWTNLASKARSAIVNDDAKGLQEALEDDNMVINMGMDGFKNMTLLHYAVEKDNITSVKILLDHGVSTDRHDQLFRKPIDLASSLEVKVFLRMYGGLPGEALYDTEKGKI